MVSWEERFGTFCVGPTYIVLQPDELIKIIYYHAVGKRGFEIVVKHRKIPSGVYESETVRPKRLIIFVIIGT